MANEVQIIINAVDKTKQAIDSAQGGMSKLVKTAGITAAAFAAIGLAAKQAFDFSRQGAQIEYAATRFERLSDSAGAVSKVLLGDLRRATRGVYSDAELMRQAGDLMALGLAKTSEEAVRLATVAGGLNMNMSQLVLTLTNKTTMRFDTLGVAVVGFQEKVDALVAAGMSADEAFSEAFLQQAEEQLERVGYAADTTLGAFMRLEAQGANALDRLKVGAAEFFEPLVEYLADDLERTNDLNDALDVLHGRVLMLPDGTKGVELLTGQIVSYEEAVRRASAETDALATKKLDDEMLSGIKSATAEARRLGDAAHDAEQAFTDLYGLTPPNVGDKIQAYIDALDFKAAGGDIFEDLPDEINNALKAGAITDEQARDMLANLDSAWESFQVSMGDLDASQAAQNISDTLGVSLDTASSTLDRMVLAFQESDGMEVEWFVRMVTFGGQGGGGGHNNNPSRPGYNVQAIQGEQNATGGMLKPNALTLVGERGAELITPEGEVMTNEFTRKALPLLQALGIFPRGMAVGGYLGGGSPVRGGTSGGGQPSSGGNVPWTPNTAGVALVSPGVYTPVMHPGRWHEQNPGKDPDWEGNNPGAPWLGGSSQAPAAVASQAATQAATAAAQGVGTAVATQASNASAAAIAEFTQANNANSQALIAKLDELNRNMLRRQDLKKEFADALAEVA